MYQQHAWVAVIKINEYIQHKPTDLPATRGSSLEVKELASIKNKISNLNVF